MPAVVESRQASIYGTFTFPIFDGQPQTDPATRPYLAPPKARATLQRTYPVIDFRDEVFSPSLKSKKGSDGTAKSSLRSPAATHLRDTGFTALCEPTSLTASSFESQENVQRIYYPEISSLIRRLTGCKTTYITNSIVRKAPTISLTVPEKERTAGASQKVDVGSHQIHLSGLPPVRIPHIDFTPLGARQELRLWREDVLSLDKAANIVAYEDAICRAAGVSSGSPVEKTSNGAIAGAYNCHSEGKLGPRYAAFSVWRPIRSITRDPLVFTPYRNISDDPELMMWQYDVRAPGFVGDWNRELEMAKVRPDCADGAVCDGAAEAAGVLHASPDIGDAAHGGLRESVEVRVLAMW
ncbi:hypothetical protein LTR37_008372 [Vermiconidia calcicola]|uniref:Uncharacterized protein n=1 Tax=Vermiconidia calcicola TaxID=1690605 RepID=A0ACC3NB86_9PEZI|nr:hypothetical protein LTR37_008372 [Vermiconidia calcicola]